MGGATPNGALDRLVKRYEAVSVMTFRMDAEMKHNCYIMNGDQGSKNVIASEKFGYNLNAILDLRFVP